MKTEVLSFKRLLLFLFSIIVFVFSIYTFGYNYIYESIDVVATKTAIIEYGSANYDVEEFINKVDGDIVSVKNDINSYDVGIQEIVFVVEKSGITKEIPVEVEVKDTVAPVINLVSDTIKIKQGDVPDLFGNIESVVDSVDGKITYSSKILEDSNDYFTIKSDVDKNIVGNYTVEVDAVDKNGNTASKEFNVVVEKNDISTRVVNLAYAQLGKAYVLGANGPDAFDCSGLVQYIYKQVGINVSRGSNTQYYDGVAVSYSDILPGDIISWGYSNDFSTHSSIYVGNGQMIHAANPSQGVILSDVFSWDNGSASNIIGVRRVS